MGYFGSDYFGGGSGLGAGSFTQISNYRVNQFDPLNADFTPSDINQRLSQLQQNISFLSSVMQTAREGSAIYGFDAPINPAIEVGQPVYYDLSTDRFELSRLDLVKVGANYIAGPSSDVWAIVVQKCAVDRATLLLDGVSSVNMLVSTSLTMIGGKWYLSDQAGRLTQNANPILVSPVLLGTGQGDILFRPWFADNFVRFAPKTIPISAQPAGTLNNTGSITTISSPNLLIPGWLPAANAVFNGLRPVGARFGYHRQVDPNLKDSWPPIRPDESRILLDNGGVTSDGYTTFLGVDTDRLIIDGNGIWWMTDRTGQLPWDLPFPLTAPPSNPPGPLNYSRRMFFEGSFAAPFSSELQQVHSLKSDVPWLQFFGQDTEAPADRGDLKLKLLPAEWIREFPRDLLGLGLKQLVDGQFTQGPLVTSIRAGSPSLSITGGVAYSPENFSGELTLSVQSSKDFDILPLRIVLQGGATDEEYQETIGIGLPPNFNTAFIAEFNIPHTISPASQAKFVFWLLAPTQMTIPAGLTTQVRRLPKNTGTPLPLTDYGPLVFNYPANSSLAAKHYVLAETNPIAVSGGDIVYIKLSRAGLTDGQSARLDVIKLIGEFL